MQLGPQAEIKSALRRANKILTFRIQTHRQKTQHIGNTLFNSDFTSDLKFSQEEEESLLKDEDDYHDITVNEDDLYTEEMQALKTILRLIKHADLNTLFQSNAIEKAMTKLMIIFTNNHDNTTQEEFILLEKWSNIFLWYIEACEQKQNDPSLKKQVISVLKKEHKNTSVNKKDIVKYAKDKLKGIRDIVILKSITFFTIIAELYCCFCADEMKENAYVFIDRAEGLLRKYHGEDKIQTVISLQCILAKLALHALDDKSVKKHLDIALNKCKQFDEELYLLLDHVAEYYKLIDPLQALYYYDQMLVIAKFPKHPFFPMQEWIKMQEDIQMQREEIVKSLLESIKRKLFDKYQGVRIIQTKIPGAIDVYIPIEIPEETEAGNKLLDVKYKCVNTFKIHKGQHNGLQFLIRSYEYDNIVREINQLIRAWTTPKKKKDFQIPDEIKTKVNHLTEESLIDKFCTLMIDEEKPNNTGNRVSKKQSKTKRKTKSIPQTATSVSTPIIHKPAIVPLFAKDKGFKEEYKDVEICPVYSTPLLQDLRRTKIFIAWKGIEGMEEDVQAEFKKMLVFNEEGVVKVPPVCHSGVKLYTYKKDKPPVLKKLGKFGSLRAQSKLIEISPQGNKLYLMGMLKRK